MANLVCDICFGALVMGADGQKARCSGCGMEYSLDRLREKIRVQNIQGAVTVNVMAPQQVPETIEDLRRLGKKYLRVCDWENAQRVYDKILDKEPSDEEAFDAINKLKVWRYMIVEKGVLKKYSGNATEVYLPDAVTSIGSRVFSSSRAVETVVFTSNVENIEREAFYQNTNIRRVLGLDGVKFIGKSAFMDCTRLEECELGNNVEYISDEAFKGCIALKNIKLSFGLKQLERAAFKGCTKLSEIIIPEKITVISASLFEQCAELKSVILPDGIIRIEANAFYGCKALNEMVLPSDIEELQPACFKESGLFTVNLPRGISEIPIQCFDRCDSLQSIVVPDNVKKIGDKAFYCCVSLVSIVFNPDIVIGKQTFFNCRKLMYVNPPEGDGNETSPSVALVDLTQPVPETGNVLPPELFQAFKNTPYYNSEILRRRSNKLCDRCAGKLGLFGKCKECGFKLNQEKK